MLYDDVRSLIQTGDLIAVRRRSGVLAIATRLVTCRPYTHTGVAVWCGGRLLMAHINGAGCSLVPVSQVSCFDVFACPVDRAKVESELWAMLGKRIHYDFIDLVRIFAHLQLGVRLPRIDRGSFVCSSMSAQMYLRAGWQPESLPSIPWPGAVVDALGSVPLAAVES